MPGRTEGRLSGCPFCKYAGSPLPQVGVRFRVLSGVDVGRIGTVEESPAPPPLSPREFLAHMDGDPPRNQRRILPKDTIEPFPLAEPPDWAAPLSLADASELDAIVVKFCEAGTTSDGWTVSWDAYYAIVARLWYLRFPITATELWQVLHAHGIANEFETQLTDFFAKGRALLVFANGRKPIKKKRVEPFSVRVE